MEVEGRVNLSSAVGMYCTLQYIVDSKVCILQWLSW